LVAVLEKEAIQQNLGSKMNKIMSVKQAALVQQKGVSSLWRDFTNRHWQL